MNIYLSLRYRYQNIKNQGMDLRVYVEVKSYIYNMYYERLGDFQVDISEILLFFYFLNWFKENSQEFLILFINMGK